MKPFKHQTASLAFMKGKPHIFDMSDPGTGKTFVEIKDFAARRAKGGKAALILGTKSILEAAWANDFAKFQPDLDVSVAFAENREKAFQSGHDVYVTNHDGVNWLVKQPAKFFRSFDTLIVDECFPAGTMVDTPFGPQPIESLKEGDYISTSSGFFPISHVFTRISDDFVDLELADGTKITCTSNHPVATEKGWVSASKLRQMRVVRTVFSHNRNSTPAVLQPQLLGQSQMGRVQPREASTNLESFLSSIDGTSQLQQRDRMSPRNESQTQCSSPSYGAPTQRTWRQRQNSPMRTDDVRDAVKPMDLPVGCSYWTKAWNWISDRIQNGFRRSETQTQSGGRRQFAHIARTLGCEERYFSGLSRVVRLTRYKSASPSLVYNLQVDGPHTYSVKGVLVHNCTAFKHHTSQRSKALAKTSREFEFRRLMSGSPHPNGICDLWHQMKILDGGRRLGPSFFAFRSAVCEPVQVGPRPEHLKWEDKETAQAAVYDLLRDVVIRHKLEDCIDMPKNIVRKVSIKLPSRLMAQYLKMEKDSILQLKGAKVLAINGAVLYTKLLQIASGSVYNDDGTFSLLDDQRYDLVLDLVQEREHSIVAFQWEHQRDALCAGATKRGITYATIDGKTTTKERLRIVDFFQKGFYQVIFAHPKSAAHGLTLTRGTATIWASPTINLEWFEQFNHRIYRAGQTQRTETIVVCATGTRDDEVYEGCLAKDINMRGLLTMFTSEAA